MRNQKGQVIIAYCAAATGKPPASASRYGIINYQYSYALASWSLTLAVLLLAVGCGINKPYPEKGLYAIEVGQPTTSSLAAATQPTNDTGNANVLQVPQLHIATPYDGNSFVYKVGPQKYTTDYYNGFITSPASLLTGQLISYLAATGLYRDVVDSNSPVDHNLVLEGNITELYGDYSNPRSAQAVIAVRFFLLRPGNNGTMVVLDKLYRATQPAQGTTPDALVQAWGQAFHQILDQITANLRAANVRSASRK